MDKNLVAEIEKDLNNLLVDVGKIMLNAKEIEVLERYNINYKNVLTLKELLFKIEEVLSLEDYPEDLEEISTSISERDYYQNTNK